MIQSTSSESRPLPNTGLQLAVQRGPAVSVPVPIAVFGATPAIISETGSGSGQGDVFVIGPNGVETLANLNNPATAGNPVVIYCVGLGAVNPPIMEGQPASGTTLSQATATVFSDDRPYRNSHLFLVRKVSPRYSMRGNVKKNTSPPS